MDIKLCLYTESLDEKHREFASRHWKKKVRLDKEYILWKYRNINNPSLTMLIMALSAEGDVIGQLGLVNYVYISDANERIPTYWFCDLMVDHEYRGKGIAKKMYEYAFNDIEGIFLGSDPSPAANISMQKIGFSSISGGSKYILPVSLIKTMSIKFPYLNNFPFIPNFFFLPFMVVVPLSNYEVVTDYKQFPDIINISGVEKKADYFEWRFFKKPLYTTQAFLLRIKGRDSFFIIYKTDLDYIIGHIAVGNKIHFIFLMFKLFSIARKEKIRSIRFIHSNFEFPEWFKLFFIKMKQKVNILWYCKNAFVTKPDAINYSYLDSDCNI